MKSCVLPFVVYSVAAVALVVHVYSVVALASVVKFTVSAAILISALVAPST